MGKLSKKPVDFFSVAVGEKCEKCLKKLEGASEMHKDKQEQTKKEEEQKAPVEPKEKFESKYDL